ncbi:MAG: MEDS domain-containing protein [Acidobacteriaceae bacterium]|nr:MEDS domain-containing protein [Acidobacteriaceae bacterium]
MKLVGDQGKIFGQSREEKNPSIRLAGSSLGSRAHSCGFFSCPEDEHQILLPFIQEGLELGEKAVHTVDPRRREDHLRRLRSAGIDVDALQVNGQFELRDWNNTRLREERFDGARNARSMGRNREIRKQSPRPRWWRRILGFTGILQP